MEAEIFYRKMTIYDIDDIIELENLCFNIPWTKNMFIEEINNENAVYYIAEINKKTVAYAGMWVIVDEGHITNIAVSPSYRRINIASNLIIKLIEESINLSIKALTLEVRASNEPAISLYKSRGFKILGKRKGITKTIMKML